MSHYRIYHLNRDGSIVCGHDAHCESDEDACEMARRLMGSYAQSEVWIGTRCVGKVFHRRPVFH